jgi:hypothetical protein
MRTRMAIVSVLEAANDSLSSTPSVPAAIPRREFFPTGAFATISLATDIYSQPIFHYHPSN